MRTAQSSVLVIGGGVSGLAAAEALTHKECQVTLLEASDRLGGRVWTQFPKDQSYPVELGAEFVHGKALTTHKYLEKIKPLKQRFCYFEDAKFSDMDNFSKILDKGFNLLDESEPDFAVSEVLARVSSDPKEAKSFAAFVEGFFAADPERLSKISIAASKGSDFTSNSQIAQGYVKLIEALKRSINAAFYTEFLCTPIEKIEWKENYVKATSQGKSWEAESAVIALPIECLKRLEFNPEIKDTKEAALFIDGGAVIKPVVTFSEPLWELGPEDHQQIVSPSLNFTTRWVWKEAPKFQLTSWAGENRAQSMINEPDDVLLDLVLQDVSALTGRNPASLKKLVEGMYFHNWITSPYSLGAYSYVKVGGKNARTQLRTPIKNTLFFAGEATAIDGSDGTVEGALNEGLRAAHQVYC